MEMDVGIEGGAEAVRKGDVADARSTRRQHEGPESRIDSREADLREDGRHSKKVGLPGFSSASASCTIASELRPGPG
jgi:hypothetical protein